MPEKSRDRGRLDEGDARFTFGDQARRRLTK
jgi:hypothetical protein